MTSNTSNPKIVPPKAREKPVFVYVRPEGFILNGTFRKTINFIVKKEFQARKLWDTAGSSPNLLCFSSDGRKSHTGKPCLSCPNIVGCQLKLRVLFSIDSLSCCLELPKTSYENYRNYTTALLIKGITVGHVTTLASVVDRGYWGEICFEVLSLQSSQECGNAISGQYQQIS